MIRAILLVLDPVASWERVARAGRGLGFIVCLYLLPLLLLTSVVEGFGMMEWGKWRADVATLKKFTLAETVGYELVQLVLSVAVVFLGAKLLKNLGETFHGRHTYLQAFTAVTYGLGPYFTLRLLDVFPGANPWVSYAIGIVLTVAILYHGVPRIMLPDPPHAFGLYLTSSLLLALTAGLARFLTVWLQQGRFRGFEDILNAIIARALPG